MPEENRYGLWLAPGGETYDNLSALITRLAKSHGAPVFEPHITLLGGITSDDEGELLRLTHLLATRVESFEVRLTETRYMDEYFRCLFLKAEPADGLIKANIEAKLVMAELIEPQEFYPHLSLLYGDFFPMVKEAIIADIGKRMDISFTADKVKLIRASGGPSDWKAVGEFRFQ
jgi:2'-5' RNA ligase